CPIRVVDHRWTPSPPPLPKSILEDGNIILRYVDELGHVNAKSGIAHIGTHALLKMLLVDNFIHAYMHPGNILVRMTHGIAPDTGRFKSKPHIIFLNVGMTAELCKKDRVNLIDATKVPAKEYEFNEKKMANVYSYLV
ncbi:hypothetical protein M8C21_025867, partial [Ambrosia artemisiifolia]